MRFLILLIVLTLLFTTTALSSLTTPDLIPFVAITVIVLGLFLLAGAILCLLGAFLFYHSGGVDMARDWLKPAAAVLVVLCVIGVLVLVWKILKGSWRFLRRGRR